MKTGRLPREKRLVKPVSYNLAHITWLIKRRGRLRYHTFAVWAGDAPAFSGILQLEVVVSAWDQEQETLLPFLVGPFGQFLTLIGV